MSGFVNPFVSGQNKRLVEFAIWLAMTLVLLAVGAACLWTQLSESLENEAKVKLAHFDTLQVNVATAFADLHRRTAAAAPCSEDFLREMRGVAFKPDGLNEFMYAPNRVMTCSTSITSIPGAVPLGRPDIEPGRSGEIALWINKQLDSIGLAGVTANVAFQEPFAIVIPRQTAWADRTSWAASEYVIFGADNHAWHLGGEAGIFAAAHGAADSSPSTIHAVACGETHSYCVAVKADVAEIAFGWRDKLVLAICLIAFYAIWPASVAYRALERYWSLPSRFQRSLSKKSVVCAYQPIVDLRTGEVSGLEVLARWRDVDGSILLPDSFIDIVANSGQTLAFTKMVADRAFEELAQGLPENRRLQLNFNVFPRDLDSEKLREVFGAFDGVRDRFPLALEIIESDALDVDDAQCQIEALARQGIKTYIDDFGSGYSSIHRVASLAIHGVKLDRCFAMAPNESLMARMLVHAVEMVEQTGQEIVVEGVETRERLDLLIETKRVAYAQGYLISRPLSIAHLAEFLHNHDAEAVFGHPRAAAA